MRVFIATVVLTTAFWVPAGADEPKQDLVHAEMKMWQGLWQTSPGGMQHREGMQVVAIPVREGPCFFVCGDRLLWLDEEGKPSGKEEKIALEVMADPKRVTLTPIGGDKDRKRTHGIYLATGSTLKIHIGLEGGPAPKQFLKLNNPISGVDGSEWLVQRKKLQEK